MKTDLNTINTLYELKHWIISSLIYSIHFIYLNQCFFFCLHPGFNSCILLGGSNYAVNVGKMTISGLDFGVDDEETE
jgi:hypothetical protein